MASSDDEMEDFPEFVSNYYFVDDNEEPISFSVLPIKWGASEIMHGEKKQIYIHGTTDDGLQKIYKPAKAWKFDLSGEKPEISVLSKDNNWIILQKPRKSFEEIIREVLITVNFLHLVKRNPESPGKVVWDKLSKIFSLYEDEPSQNDVVGHMDLIEQAMKQDESLTKSKCLMTFLGRMAQKKRRADEDGSTGGRSEIVDDDDESAGDDSVDDVSGEEEDGDEEPFDSVCAICDNGGDLLCCEGPCMRSFHATQKAADEAESGCASLGLSEKEVKAIPNFKCKNCQYKLHQCFSCGKLGSSDKSSGAKVFQCVNATCGYFYHPRCVGKLLHGDEVAAKELQEKIFAGESFACPLHICSSCKHPEDKTDPELQMAVCRRCPKAFHKKCLPRKIAFEENEDEGVEQRAWSGLLADRILIYCMTHTIIDDLGTPQRNHIKFPDDDGEEKKSSAVVSMKGKVVPKKKESSLAATFHGVTASQSFKKTVQNSRQERKDNMRLSKLKGTDTSSQSPTAKKSVLKKVDGSSISEERRSSLGDKLFAFYTQQSDTMKPGKSGKLEVESTKTSILAVKSVMEQLNSDSEERILDLMNEASSIITLDDIIEKHEKLISGREYKQKIGANKSITLGKLERSSQAVREASKKLDGGGSVEDAKGICQPEVLNQMAKWKSKLRVYLAPFLNGRRYTSFGRHFTKIEKLREVVDTIHWYTNNGDTIVDFCCGANDFSWLMKQKLESMGKKCSYKNYDLFQPKNDFCFERRDWMNVQPSELPTGSQLIMGLNPPFGVRAALANKFINKALQFKPKLLILIVPPETERLDKKKTPYDLVWEDTEKLSGKSFYLPGSVDINDKQMEDWNIVAPVLYLWSRKDWTVKHKKIAEKNGHLHGERESRLARDPSLRNHDQNAIVMKVDGGTQPSDPADGQEEVTAGVAESLEDRPPRDEHGREKLVKGQKKSKANKGSKKKRQREGKHGRGAVENPPEYKRWRPSPNNPRHGGTHQSPGNTKEKRPSMEGGYSSRHQGSPSNMVEAEDPPYDHFEPTAHAPSHYGRGYDGNPSSYYPERTGNYNVDGDIYASGREGLAMDYGPRRSGEWSSGYPREPEGYGVNRPLQSELNPRYRPLTYLTEPGHGRMNEMPATQRYAPRLDELNHVRMGGGFVPEMAAPQAGGGGIYHYQAPRQAYPGGPMGFAPGPPNPFPRHGSGGGWIVD